MAKSFTQGALRWWPSIQRYVPVLHDWRRWAGFTSSYFCARCGAEWYLPVYGDPAEWRRVGQDRRSRRPFPCPGKRP